MQDWTNVPKDTAGLPLEEGMMNDLGGWKWADTEQTSHIGPAMLTTTPVSGQDEDISRSLSFKELHAERNKQAQRRFRKRQKEKLTELQEKLAQLKAEKSEMEQKQRMLDSACHLRDEELHKIRERQKAQTEAEEDDLSRSFQGAVTLTFREQETITLTPGQIKQLSEQDLAKFWSNYVKELAVLLVSMEGDDSPSAEVESRMKMLVQNELLFLYIRAALTNMQSVKKFIAKAKIEEVRVTAGAQDATNRWHQVSQALQLSAHQGQNIARLWRGFVDHVARLSDERLRIHRAIAEASHTSGSSHEAAAKYLQTHENMELLRKNLRAEHVQIHEFIVAFFLRELSVKQMARCFVRSFPFYPDIPAIAAWVAVAQKDTLAQSKLAALQCSSPSISS